MARDSERTMIRAAGRRALRMLGALAPVVVLVLGLVVGAGCRSLAEGHCGNGSGDQQCREREQGMFCSQCTLANDGCVEELPAEVSCRVMDSASGSEATASSSGSGSDASSSDTSQGSSGGIPSCAELGNTCLEAAPADFLGPVALLSEPADGRPTACAEPFGRQAIEAFSELAAPAAACSCDCGSLTGGQCGGAGVRHYTGSGCVAVAAHAINVTAGCNNFPGTWPVTSGSFFFEAPTVIAGSCAPEASVEVQPPTFLTRHLACEGTFAAMSCASDELCLPTPGPAFSGQWCVWQEGEHECPARSVYSERSVRYRDSLDERGCEACTCELPEGACVGATATLAVESNCMGSAAGTLSANACVNAIGAGPPADAVSVNLGAPPVSTCVPNEPMPTGMAVPSSPVTFCCTQ